MCDEMLVAHTGRGDASTSYLPRERRRHSGTPDLLVPALTFGLSYEASWYPPTTQDEASVAAPPSGASTWRALGTPSYERHFVPPPPCYWIRSFLKSKVQPPPLPEGRLDFPKSPRSNPPLPEGRLDFRKSTKSNAP